MGFHPVLSQSPLERAFCYVASQSSTSTSTASSGGIDADLSASSRYRDHGEHDADETADDLPPFWLSPPEVSLLRSAEENPLEYTLAEADDAVSYARILLKMLDQVTNLASTSGQSMYYSQPSATSRNNSGNNNSNASSPQNSNNSNNNFVTERILALDTPVFSEDEAFDLYYRSKKQHKRLVVAHYCVTKLYEIVAVLDNSSKTRGTIPSLVDLFYGSTRTEPAEPAEDFSESFPPTIHLERDDWRPLLKILYSRTSDEYTKRGSALLLAYILNAGCEWKKTQQKSQPTARRPDEDLLFLFSEEHKSTSSPPTTSHNRIANAAEEDVVEETLQSLISWLTSRLQTSVGTSLGVVTPTLGVLLSTNQTARLAFCQSGGIGYISRHLRSKRPKQTPPPTASTLLPPRKPKSSFDSSSPSSQPVAIPSFALSESSSARFRTSRSQAVGKRSSTGSNLSLASSQSFGSGMSDNLDDIFQSLPSTGQVEKNLGDMISTASGAAAAAAAGISSLAESMRSTEQNTLDSSGTTASSSSSVQQLYDLVFCLWCLSLDASAGNETVRKQFARDGAIPALASLLKKAPREKVLRMTLACLRTLATLPGASSQGDETIALVRDMIGCGIPKSLVTVQQRRWNDADLEEDLEFLIEWLSDHTKELTQWKAYEAQLHTGILKWDEMLHTHEFFRANAQHMEGPKNDFAPLQKLIDILYFNTTSGKLRRNGRSDQISYVGLNEVGGWDEEDVRDEEICETLAVCLFGLGEFARNYPNGRAVLASRGGNPRLGGAKALVMQYMNHPSDEVKKHALLCASKLLVRNWRAIEN